MYYDPMSKVLFNKDIIFYLLDECILYKFII